VQNKNCLQHVVVKLQGPTFCQLASSKLKSTQFY